MFRLFRLTRTIVLLLVLLMLAGAAACFVNAGRMLVDPRAMETPRPADAIIVLSGSPADRWLEAYDLWREERAPVIVLSPGYRDGAARALQARGVHVPADHEIARDVMTRQLGLPQEAVRMLGGPLDNTAAEASATLALARAEGWKSVIVVTSLPHTRRTALAMHRVLTPAGVAVQVRGSRYDVFQAAQWWRSRANVRWVITELPKLAAYRLGLAN